MDDVTLIKEDCKKIIDNLRHLLRYLPEKIKSSDEYKSELKIIHSLISKLETNFVCLQDIAEKQNAIQSPSINQSKRT